MWLLFVFVQICRFVFCTEIDEIFFLQCVHGNGSYKSQPMAGIQISAQSKSRPSECKYWIFNRLPYEVPDRVDDSFSHWKATVCQECWRCENANQSFQSMSALRGWSTNTY